MGAVSTKGARARGVARVCAFPRDIVPMLAWPGEYPKVESRYAFEPKWDGIRAVAYLDRGRMRIQSRNLNDITAQYPELRPLGGAFAGRQLVLDGEIVAPDETGRASFQRLQSRLGVVQRGRALQRSEASPVVYVVFDLLYVDGEDIMPLPYEERRARLEALALRGPSWRMSPAREGEGRELLEMPQWEGVIAKRLGSRYEPGVRSRAWIKVKRLRRQEFVIAGWTEGRGSRSGRIGALLLGYFDGDELRYAGSVGTGFDTRTLDLLGRLLEPEVCAASPFAGPIDKAQATFVTPRYVCEIEFTEWTADGKLRHPSYKGLREDKNPRKVVREEK